MKHNQQDKIYEAEELLHYLSGNMTPQEMYAIERAALDDDMLADAIEGFRAMRKTMSDDAILAKVKPTAIIGNQTTSIEQATAPVIKINWIKRISYAAAAIIILGAGWWIFNENFIKNNASTDEIASIQPVELLPEDLYEKKVDGMENEDEATLDTNKHETASIAAQEPVTPKVIPPSVSVTATTPPVDVADVVRKDDSKATAAMADAQMARLNNERQLADMREESAKQSAAPSRKMMVNENINHATVEILMPKDTSAAIPFMGWSNIINQLEKPTFKTFEKDSITVEWIINESGKNEQINIQAPYNAAQKRALMQIINQTEPWKVKEAKPVKVQLRIE